MSGSGTAHDERERKALAHAHMSAHERELYTPTFVCTKTTKWLSCISCPLFHRYSLLLYIDHEREKLIEEHTEQGQDISSKKELPNIEVNRE
jgi:hypothetical protein